MLEGNLFLFWLILKLAMQIVQRKVSNTNDLHHIKKYNIADYQRWASSTAGCQRCSRLSRRARERCFQGAESKKEEIDYYYVLK